MKSFAHFPAGANDLTGDTFVRADMFEYKTCVHGQALLHHNQRAVRADALRENLESCRFSLQRHMNIGAYAQKHALSATPFLA